MPDFQKLIEFKLLLTLRHGLAALSARLSGRRVGAFMLATLLLLSAQVRAVTVNDLYSANVPLQGSGAAALTGAYNQGLSQVLVRVAGSREVLQRDGIKGVLEAAETMLVSYQVLRDGNGSRVQMKFGAVAVTQGLASIQAPVWGANRPLTLAWIALEERGGRTLITKGSSLDGASSEFRASLEGASRERGLPLVLPQADRAGDRELLSDIWGQFVNRVRDASNDLSRDAMALVRVSRSGDQWRAGWVVDGFNSATSGEQTLSADTPAALAQALVYRWTELYASRYAVSGTDAGQQPTVDVVIQNVSSLSDYAKVTDMLRQLNPIDSFAPTEVTNNELTMRLTFSGELDQLRENIALDARMAAQPAKAGASEEQALQSLYPVLIYRWQPAPVADAAPR